jgi:hypothetical protein
MFTVITDTSSRIVNFQPGERYETDSGRFSPIVTMIPGFEFQAHDLKVPSDYRDFDEGTRLIRYGRLYFYALLMSKSYNRPIDLLPRALLEILL